MKNTMTIGASNGKIKIFAGNSNRELAEKIAAQVNIIADEVEGSKTKTSPEEVITLGPAEVGKFADGEISLNIGETVRECDVYLIQSTSQPVNDNLMELLIMIDAVKRASARRITAVIPYYGYSRQDRKVKARDPISAKLVADLLTAAGAHRVLTVDLHCSQIQGFFDIPVDHLMGMPLFVEYYQNKFQNEEGDLIDTMVVSPDLGSVTRARSLAKRLDVKMAIVDKRRHKKNETEVMNIIGDITGKKVILVDDEIDTAGSITNAAKALKEAGAKEVYACCTHGKFSGAAIERIIDSPIEELVTLDTIRLPKEKQIDKIKVLSVDRIFGSAIYRIHEGLPVSDLYEVEVK